MRTIQFGDDNAAMNYIVMQLGKSLPHPLARGIAEQYLVRCQMAEELDAWPGRTEESFEGETVIGAPWWGPWTVRDHELRDVGNLAITLVGLWPMTPLSDLVDLVLSAACMLWRLSKCGVHISPLQRDVLIALRRSGGSSINDLAVEASAFGSDWTLRDVQLTIKELSAVRLPSGMVVPLVHQDADGYWSTDARVWEVPFGAG